VKRRVAWGICAGLTLAPCAALAGAWTWTAGTGQATVTGTMSSATRTFDTSGVMQPTTRYNKFELQGWFEYGVTDRFTAIVAPGLQHVDIAPPTDSRRSGLGYTEFGGRYSLLQGDSWVFSGQATMRVPGTNDTSNPAAIGYTGVETDLRGLLGTTFSVYGMAAFVDVQLAQRLRAGGPPNEFRADATFGIRPAARWMVLAQSFNVISEGAGSPPFSRYEYFKLQLSAIYALNQAWSVQLGGFTAYAGRNALQENGAVLGLWYRF
jgi:hypothetical protein